MNGLVGKRSAWFQPVCRVGCAAVVAIMTFPQLSHGQVVAPKADAEAEGPPKPRQLELITSDGVELMAWYYAPSAAGGQEPAAAGTALATVVVVHDLGGSHESVEPLCLKLRDAGYAVVAPDLRGHGESTGRTGPSGRKETISSDQLRKADLEAIAAVAGGSVRDQASMRGDLEVVRNWIKTQGELDADRLCLVGSGLGGTLAALWAANDRTWGDRPLASGPQGDEVRALVLVSPVFATKGVSFGQALGDSGIRNGVPILIVSGGGDRDAPRLFDQLKRQRPESWFEQRASQEAKSAPELKKPSDATLFFMRLNTSLAADELIADRQQTPADRIMGFFKLVVNRKQR